MNGETSKWRHNGVKVIPGDKLDTNTAQTPGMNRAAAINDARVGAQKIWAGTVHIHPNAKTGAHHHGALECVIYVVSGRARMRWGDQLEFIGRGGAGRFHLRSALRAAPGDQRRHRRGAVLRAGAQRPGTRGREPGHRTRGTAGRGVLGRSDPPASLTAAPVAVVHLSVSTMRPGDPRVRSRQRRTYILESTLTILLITFNNNHLKFKYNVECY